MIQTIQCDYCDNEVEIDVDPYGAWADYPDDWEYDNDDGIGYWTCPECLEIFEEEANIRRVRQENNSWFEEENDNA